MARPILLLGSLFIANALAAQNSASSEEIAKNEPAPLAASLSTIEGPDRIEVLENQMQELLTDTPLGNFGAKTASARPQIHSNRLYIKGDGFLWKAFIGGNDYAAITINENAVGDSKRADFRWRWGLRAELGYHLPHDQWDAIANYTWFHDKSDQTAVSQSPGTIIPLFPVFTYFSPGATAAIRWHLLYQNFDLELKKSYFLNRHFSVSPFFGLRNTWIEQGYRVRYSDPDSGTPQFINVFAHQDFWGIGPLAGMSSEWHITNQWLLFGSFTGAVLASDYDISGRISNNDGPNDNIKANTTRMSPTVQGTMGFGWHMNLNRNRNHIAIRVSYEAQYWWKQNLTLNYNSSYYSAARSGEDLGFHGFTLDTLFDF